VRFTTYNLYNLFASESAEDRKHYETVVAAIRSVDSDVLAVQEILAPDGPAAAGRLRQLAHDVGLRCEVPGPAGRQAALAVGGHGYHVGLMWRDGIEPVSGSLRLLGGGGDFWHGLAMVTLDVGGFLVRHGSFHATPFGRGLRAGQNERLVAAVTRPQSVPTLIGADWNTESADRVLTAGGWELYEPADPYAAVEWFADLIYQCEWDYDEQGRRRHWADRRPGDVLWAGGLHDAAALLRAQWQATAGHHPDDVYGAHGVRRRIDGVRVTVSAARAVRAHRVLDTALTQEASDHLPVTVEYEPAAVEYEPDAATLWGSYGRNVGLLVLSAS
jgi:endonuclease/exonuclease/phosphatase family metal-dependent hydrolase